MTTASLEGTAAELSALVAVYKCLEGIKQAASADS